MRPEHHGRGAGSAMLLEGARERAAQDHVAVAIGWLAEHRGTAGEGAAIARIKLDLEGKMLGHSTSSGSSDGCMLSGCIRASPPSIGGRFSRALASFAVIQAAPAVALPNAS
jgi:hypothetical protein